MLIQFAFKNFRSYAGEANFSMVPVSNKSTDGSNVHPTNIKGVQGLLKTAAIYGPNAGGKSNLLMAIHMFCGVVTKSATVPISYNLPNESFALDQNFRTLPTEFEADFIVSGTRYRYGFSTVSGRVESERLHVFHSAKQTLLFERCYHSDTQEYSFEFGASLPGPKKTWQQSTRPNALFLSSAAQLNSEVLGQIVRYFQNSWSFAPGGTPSFEYTVEFMKRKENTSSVLALLKAADTGIEGVSFRKEMGQQLQFKMKELEKVPIPEFQEIERDMPVFNHRSGIASADIEFEEESDGTKKFFGLAGIFLEILEHGRTVFVDELDRSLHPLFVRRIVEMFNSPESNPKGAQLVFTTHDTTLLDPELLRRDQIWFAEKNRDQASVLYSLSDISVRKDEAFAKGYLSGRYGALPVLEKFAPFGSK